jgi:hypothetical protein
MQYRRNGSQFVVGGAVSHQKDSSETVRGDLRRGLSVHKKTPISGTRVKLMLLSVIVIVSSTWGLDSANTGKDVEDHDHQQQLRQKLEPWPAFIVSSSQICPPGTTPCFVDTAIGKPGQAGLQTYSILLAHTQSARRFYVPACTHAYRFCEHSMVSVALQVRLEFAWESLERYNSSSTTAKSCNYGEWILKIVRSFIVCVNILCSSDAIVTSCRPRRPPGIRHNRTKTPDSL